MRRIRIIGDIDYDSYKLFVEELSVLESENKKPITIELTSEGGNPYASLAFYSRIQQSPCDITIEVYGYCASAAVLVLASAVLGSDKRRMSMDAWIMVHEEQDTWKNKSVHDIEVEVAHSRAMEDQCNTLLESVTRTSAAEWEKMHKATTYLTAKQAKQLGLIDEIF